MPWGLKRFQQTGRSHFVTFSCYHRQPFFTSDSAKRTFEIALERVRRIYELRLYAYVVMPEHVHLLVSEPAVETLAVAIKSLKQGVSRQLLGSTRFVLHQGKKDYQEKKDCQEKKEETGAPLKPGFGLSGGVPEMTGAPLKPSFGLSGDFPEHHFWQKRYYDFNVRNYPHFVEKLRYIHRNPVTRGLCERPEDWKWSSFRQCATGCEGRVEIECEWAARNRERAAGRLCDAVELPHSSQTQA